MERSGGVAETFARITRMMDRSNLGLLNAIDDFEGWMHMRHPNAEVRFGIDSSLRH